MDNTIELIHQVRIGAPREVVYEAITTPEGIRSWWTRDVTMSKRPGGKAVFGFDRHAVWFQMRIEKMRRPSLVRWKCDGSSSEEWVGTTLEFVLEPPAESEMVLRFCHAGWRKGSGSCYFCNTTWGHLLVLLKTYAERGVRRPYFT